ncbi:MAG: YihY/virulence factor BrkB family protein [Thermoguttaceae bacterium]|jgi:membrane protein
MMLGWLTHRAWPVIRRTWRGWQENDGFLLSAAMAYYAALALLPLCLVLIAALGFVLRLWSHAEDAQQQLLAAVAKNAGPWLSEQLEGLLMGVKSQAGRGGPIGAIALLLAAIGVFLQFDAMFDRIWGTGLQAPWKGWWAYIRSFLYGRLAAFLMLLAVGGLVLALFLANMVLAAIRPHLETLHLAWIQPYLVHLPGGQLAWTALSDALLFTIIYKVLPKVRVRWREALPAGTLVAVVWIIGQQVLVSLVIGTGYTAYGVVGSFIAVMLWLYYASATIFFGAEFVRAMRGPAGRKAERRG